MKKKFLVVFILGLLIIPSLIRSAEPELRTIIIEPPQTAEFKVDVWTDKGDNAKYTVGEKLIIYFKVTQDAYVYIWDINANGEIRLLFPNRYNNDNFARANMVYSIPSPRDTYSLKIAPPYGREVVHILASKTPISTLEGYKTRMEKDPFPLIPEAPENFTDSLKRTIEIVPAPVQWTTDNAIFYVVESPVSTGTGRLIVESNPRGATITMDGRFLGYTPYDGQVPIGRHTIRLDLAGYQPYTTEVNVTTTQVTRVSVGLTPLYVTTGRLIVESNPKGASITMDGRFLGYTPYDGQVPVGRHTIRLDLAGYQSYITEVNVTPNKTAKVDVKLKPISIEGAFYITSNPDKAEVYINGDRKGRTPLKVEKLKPGRYQITIIKSGYETFVAYYEIFSGQITTVNVQLYPIR